MQFDVDTNLAATDRSVSSLERDGQPARAVTLSRVYATTVEDHCLVGNGATVNGHAVIGHHYPHRGVAIIKKDVFGQLLQWLILLNGIR